MALAKDQIPHDSSMGSKVQSYVFNDNSAMNITTLRGSNNEVVNEYHKCVLEDEDGSQSTNGYSNDSAITHSPTLCANNNNNNGYAYKSTNYQIEEEESLINFKAEFSNSVMQGSGESLLSFQHNMKDHSTNIHRSEHYVWENNDHNYWNQIISPRITSSEIHLVQDFSSFHQTSTTSSYNSTIVMNNSNEKHHGESSYGGWLYSEEIAPTIDHSIKESSSSGAQESVLKRRHSTGDQNMKGAKKQNSTESKTQKPKSGPSKDPQSVAAKNRRERISERLKILQDLVPNGSKVDLVTMLEKAISYVKFLQLQVKVLATDEFWPVQGGKAPDISQVKEVIDAILSSQRDRTSSSK